MSKLRLITNGWQEAPVVEEPPPEEVPVDEHWNNVLILVKIDDNRRVVNAKTGAILSTSLLYSTNTVGVEGEHYYKVNYGVNGVTSDTVAAIGTGDFCLDFWLKYGSFDGAAQRFISSTSGNPFLALFGDSGYGHKMLMCAGPNPGALRDMHENFNRIITKSNFHTDNPNRRHFAMDRKSGLLRYFLDGELIGSDPTASNSTPVAEHTNNYSITSPTFILGQNLLDSYFWRYRLTKASRFRENFDPSKLAYFP